MPLSRRILLVATGATLLTATAARAFIWGDTLEGVVFDVGGVAIRGTDTVAYHTEGRPVPGDPAFAHDWNGATWHFASAGNRDLFAADPTAYAPAYGGYCAWAIAAKASLATTQPENWEIVDGQLYLNYNDAVEATWRTDIPGFIAQGDANWPGVAAEAAS